MSSAEEEVLKRRYRELLDLMPLTVAIAGLKPADGTQNYNSDQMEFRMQTLATAHRLARQMARDIMSPPKEAPGRRPLNP